MRQKKSWFIVGVTLAVIAVALVLAPGAWAASTFKVLHRFTGAFIGGTDAAQPEAGLIFDAAGNVYGTTARGGGSVSCGLGCGTVFRLTPNPDGTWTESVLHSFDEEIDGESPFAGLIFDAVGNLYGTTAGGGGPARNGTVFKLTPNPDGSWTESVLHSFRLKRGADGAHPFGGLIFDAAGNLYGVTVAGGASTNCPSSNTGCGVVFKLTPNSNGSWTERVIHSFCSVPNCADGGGPIAGLIFDAAGNLYGTTQGGGSAGNGTVFKLTPNSDGSWTESVLHSFTGADGHNPFAGLIFDAAGNLYGTTNAGGASTNCSNGCGVVFKLTPNSDGTWTERVIHTFGSLPAVFPDAGLVLDAAGNLYGTTLLCVLSGGCGTVFKMTPN